MSTITELQTALTGAATEVTAVKDAVTAYDAAVAAVVDPENITGPEQTAIDDAQTALDTARADAGLDALKTAAANLKITDCNMVSNDMAKDILAVQGKPQLFEEPVDVKTDHNMQPVV